MSPRELLFAHLRRNDPRLMEWAADVLARAPFVGLDEALRSVHLVHALAA
ncbi:hypothetical protein SEA_BARNSTORMER_64 [Microbacterium phage Barnstormer]|uniref:Uncharacterized protein n=1 Tax=Microbacterium phage Barnstormer TaxID=3028491 RepID=A0AAE9ZN81_9CAUD|nr:hypothetical protein SEA_BARNSTORMER_64 [Microbacterium phage Barnstormer]WDS52170.1 hypothetical protein SEA_UTZCHIPS_64 [Microbacterium phage UtzChips]